MTIDQELSYLQIEIAKLRAENARLRNRVEDGDRHGRRVRQARQDALLLATWRAGGIPPSRAFAARHAISQRRWQNALALLRLARVIEGRRRWRTSDLATIARRIDGAEAAALASPDAFRARLIRHGRQ